MTLGGNESTFAWLIDSLIPYCHRKVFSLSLSPIEINLVTWVALTAINEVLCVARVLYSWSLCTFGFYAQYFQVVFSFISFTPLTICPSICDPLSVEFDAFSQMVYSTPTFNTNRNIKTSHLPIKPLWSMYLCVCGQQPNMYRLIQHPLSSWLRGFCGGISTYHSTTQNVLCLSTILFSDKWWHSWKISTWQKDLLLSCWWLCRFYYFYDLTQVWALIEISLALYWVSARGRSSCCRTNLI